MTDLVPANTAAPVAVPSTWDASWRLAQRIAHTPFVPAALRGKPEAVLAAVLFGAELGLGPMQSLAQIHVIDGRPAAAPEMMRALIARAGHRIDVLESVDDRVTLAGRRADTGAEAKVTWTWADAQRAKLTGKSNWATYPRAMLLARATGELARMLFPDVIAGLSYTPEEVSSMDDPAPTWTDDRPAAAPARDADVVDAEVVVDFPIAVFERIRTMARTWPACVAELKAWVDAQDRKASARAFADDPEWAAAVDAWLDGWLEDTKARMDAGGGPGYEAGEFDVNEADDGNA